MLLLVAAPVLAAGATVAPEPEVPPPIVTPAPVDGSAHEAPLPKTAPLAGAGEVKLIVAIPVLAAGAMVDELGGFPSKFPPSVEVPEPPDDADMVLNVKLAPDEPVFNPELDDPLGMTGLNG